MDFDLETDHPITIKNKDCALILFYTENQESRDLAQIWSLVSQIAPGPSYFAVNMVLYPRVAQAFTRISTVNTSLKPFELRGYPFILSYQNGWPVAFYNGERSAGTLSDWATTLACRAGYHEPIQLAGGTQTDADFQMNGWTEYMPKRQTSVEYTIGNPIRKFNQGAGANLVTSSQRSTEVASTEGGGTVPVAAPGTVPVAAPGTVPVAAPGTVPVAAPGTVPVTGGVVAPGGGALT
jgi:hypothetical protein